MESAVGKVGMSPEWKRGNTNAVSAQGTTEDGRRRSEIVAAGGPRVEVKKGGWAWAAEGRHWRPSTRQENGPPAAEGRPWGRLNLRGGPEATHPQGRKRKGEGERQCSGGGRSWARTIERGAQGREGRPSTRKHARAQTRMCRYTRAHAHAQARGGQGTRETGRWRHRPGANAVVDKGAVGHPVRVDVGAVRARAAGGS